MNRFSVSILSRVILIVSTTAACAGDEIAAPNASSDLAVREARAVSPSYAVTEIGTLPGDIESIAWEVNDAGYVVVMSTYYSMTEPRTGRWFIRSGAQNFMMPAIANGISSGSLAYLAGSEGGLPTLRRFSPSTGFSDSVSLDYSGGYGGSPNMVNDLGDATGTLSYVGGAGDAAIWKTDGSRIVIPNVNAAVYENGAGRDINNNGDIAIQYHDNSGLHRGYVRTADGVMIVLPPLAGHASSLARGISEPVNGRIYVAGTSDDRNGNYNTVRWTIDLASHSIIATQALPERSYANAMADDGTIVGDIVSTATTTAFVWKHTGLITLKTPKGSSSGRAWSVSGNGKYVSGDAKYGSYMKAVFWTAP